MNNKAAAIATEFETFVGSMHDEGAVPVFAVVDHFFSVPTYYKQTGFIPVLAEDETVESTVFSNHKNKYEFEAWAAYREMTHEKKQFQAMVGDILDRKEWSKETISMISAVHGLVHTSQQYEEKYKHAPVDMAKFMRSYMKNGATSTLARDRY